MNRKKRCAKCKRQFLPNPRVKQQEYCGRRLCQRARKTKWQRQKLASDPDYLSNQKDAQSAWRQDNPDYWGQYRYQHPEYVQRNRALQAVRNARRACSHKRQNMHASDMIAKMDALSSAYPVKSGCYFILPDSDPVIAKMDAFNKKWFIIPAT